MSMTRGEAIAELQACVDAWDRWVPANGSMADKNTQAVKMALSALRPVSREQVEKAWRGEWIGMTDDDGCTWYECSQCEHDLDSLEVPNHFCPACGAPMTDEAVETIMKRMEEMRND